VTRFIAIRLLYLVMGWVIASVLIFFTLRILPGDVAQVIAGTQATPERVADLRQRLGLDQNIISQYFEWMQGILTLNVGNSLVTGSDIGSEIAQKLEVTLPLTLMALIVGALIAFPLGIIAALKHGQPSSRLLSSSAVTLAAVPVVWAGLLLILVFSSWLGWFPSQGFPREGWANPAGALVALALPAITIGLVEGAVLLRFVRSATLSALGSDHVRTAMSHGMTRTEALLRRGVPGVGLSIISLLGLQVAGLFVGAVIIEQLFSLPGLGRMLVTDVANRNLPSVQTILLVLTGIILLVGTTVDIVHRLIDPRLRTEIR
jgi:peptide/nickel transport system permease protein